MNFDRDWIDEARRYLTNIVGKYGPHIQLLLGKAAGILDQIKFICPLHGPVWRKDLATSSTSTTSGAAMSRRKRAS